MGADIGVYILATNTKDGGKEYRVKALQAIENLDYDPIDGGKTNSTEVIINNAREMWKGCRVWTTRDKAVEEAQRILKGMPICDYGIVGIDIAAIF